MPRKRGIGRFVLLVGAAVVVVLLFTAWQALKVRTSLNGVAVGLTAMTDAAAAGDVKTARRELASARADAASANTHTRGPVWWTASKLPRIGDDVTAVRVVSEVAHDLTGDTLPDLVAAAARLTPGAMKPTNGRLDLDPISAAAPALRSGSKDIADAATRIEELETAGLIGALEGPVVALRDKLEQAEVLTARAATAARLLPPMLGSERKRTYLLMFQNNAEVRAGGGLPGAFAVITADDGKVDMVRQSRPAEVGFVDPPVGNLTRQEVALFTERPGQYSQDTVMVPHFPRAAELMSEMWLRTQDQQVDGVLSMDPVAMSYLLGGTGVIDTPRGQIAAGNAVDELLRDTYLEVPTDDEQNAFFALVARTVFERVLDAPSDPRALLDGLVRGVDERRFLLWSRHPEEQKAIAGTAIAAEVPAEAARRPEVGVYLNDSGSDKLTYYLDHRVDVRPRSCGSEGNQILEVRLTLTSNVPVGDPLTEFVVGPGSPGLALGDMRLTSYLYAPVGGRIDEATLDGEPVTLYDGVDRGREVGALTTDIGRGESRVLEYVVYTGRDQTGKPRVLSTPGVRDDGIGQVGASAC